MTSTNTTQEQEQVHERLEAFARLLEPLANQTQTQVPFYVEVENYFGQKLENDGWLCEEHAEAYTAKYGGEIVPNVYGTEENGICMCEVCGALLAPFNLSEYGTREELAHWEGVPTISLTPEHCWELLHLVEAVDASECADIRERVAALQSRLVSL